MRRTFLALGLLGLVGLGMLSGCGDSNPKPAAPIIPPPTLGNALKMPEVGASIQPPRNWVIDQLPGDPNATLRGPKEKGFPPLIICSVERAPGELPTYVAEHKARIAAQDKNVKWISEGQATLDGRPAVRLEYESEVEAEPPAIGKVRVRALQYLMEDKPAYYRVTCFVAANAFERYVERFEASAKTFTRAK